MPRLSTSRTLSDSPSELEKECCIFVIKSVRVAIAYIYNKQIMEDNEGQLFAPE